MTFREALEYSNWIFPTSVYRQGIDSVITHLMTMIYYKLLGTQKTIITRLALKLLLQLPENADLATAYENRQEAKQIIDELGIIQQ